MKGSGGHGIDNKIIQDDGTDDGDSEDGFDDDDSHEGCGGIDDGGGNGSGGAGAGDGDDDKG